MSSQWWEVSIQVPAEAVEAAAAIFRYFGREDVAIEADIPPDEGDDDEDVADSPRAATVKTYLPQDIGAWHRITTIDVALGHLASDSPSPPLYVRILNEDDWANAWKSHFHVLKIGQRLVVKPWWETYDPGEGDIVIGLDPGMAFGTGLHPTTQMCLRELETRLRPGMKVLDVGTGSGILSIAAAKLGAASVVALDIDPEAAWVAEQNIAANQVAETVEVFPGTLDGQRPLGAFHLVVANITTGVITDLAPRLVQALEPGGTLIAGGIFATRWEQVQQALIAAGAQVIVWRQEGNWRTVVAGRHSTRENEIEL